MQDNSKHSIKIVRLPEERWRDSMKLRLEALKNDESAFGSSYEEEEKFESDVWKRRMKNAYFALDGDIPVGMISCLVRNRIKTHHVADIFGLYVKPEYRRVGIGRLLMESAFSFASEQEDVIKICLTVCTAQKPAYELYTKLGFKKVGELKKELKIGRRYYDEILMEKFLR